MKKVSILIREPSLQYEGLRTSLGLLLEDVTVQMFVLDHEIEHMNEAYSDNLGFFDEMGGGYYSNNSTNVEKHGFQYADLDTVVAKIRTADLILPL